MSEKFMSFTIETALQTYLFHASRASRFKNNEYKWPTLVPELQEIWEKDIQAASILAEDYENVTFEDYSEKHGCLKYVIEEETFWVPTVLTRFLPRPDVLLSLYKSATTGQLFEDSRICLSGSSVLMGSIPRIGDLDLFEYVNTAMVAEALKEERPKYQTSGNICTKVKVGDSLDGKWPDAWVKIDDTQIFSAKIRPFAAKYLHQHNFCKIDMIGKFNNQVGEITNIIYKQPEAGNYSIPFPTFTFQEVSIGSAPPSIDTFSLKNFGDYLFFLQEKLENFMPALRIEVAKRSPIDIEVHTSAVKVTKRALVLAALIGADDLVESFQETLNSNGCQTYALKSAAACLTPLIDSRDKTSTKLTSEALKWIAGENEKIEDENRDELDLAKLHAGINQLLSDFEEICFPNKEYNFIGHSA